MAIEKSVVVRADLSAPNAYHKIRTIDLINNDIAVATCHIDVFASEASRLNNEKPILDLKFSYANDDLLNGNILQLLYNHLKTLTVSGIDYTVGTTDI